MAVSGTAVKTKSNVGTLDIAITGFLGATNTTPVIFGEGLPFGSVCAVIVSGTAPTNLVVQGSNDGVNFAQISSTGFFGANLVVSLGPSNAPCKYYQFGLTVGDGTTAMSFFVTLMGTRG